MVTDYQLNRRERMNEYLDSLKEEVIQVNGDESVIWLAKDFLILLINKLAQRSLVLEVPDCCPNNGSQGDFNIFFTWDRNEHYLECEILNSGGIEFYYRNRLDKNTLGWEEDYSDSGQPLSSELIEKLSLFVE